jgi:Spy/CpxP family protein refolding chaperone
MFEVKMRFRIQMILMAMVAILSLTSLSRANQDPAPPAGVEDDPIQRLRLTPEQRQRIRMIAEENKDERQMINRRVREANVALDQAMDVEPIDDNVIQQRINDLATAQAAQLRMRIQMELKIRRELRPEQLAILKQLRLQIRDLMGARQRPLDQRPARQGLRPNQRNTVFPRRP